jgi:hypothetical protein
MRTPTSCLALIGAAALSLCFSSAAFADEHLGATVIKEFGCQIAPADSGLSAFLFTTETHIVNTPSGNTTLVCHFDVPEELQDEVQKAMKHEGFGCGTQFGVTFDTFAVTNKNRVLLNCSIYQ